VIKRALKNDVWLINVGAEIETSKRAVEYSQKYPQGVFAAVGLHPIHLQEQKIKEKDFEVITKAEKFDYEKYKVLAQNPKVVAIGEIGLDYYRIEQSANRQAQIEIQKEVFLKQLELAQELNKAVIIHCREAHNDLLEIISNFQFLISKPRGVIHSFSGNLKQARQYRQMGFKIAFNGIITFARDYDKVVLDTPLEDILLETDCPYLTPVPYRGKRNEPSYIIEIAKKIAEIKNISLEEVARQTTLNAKEVFGL
jgi:TatD DNase family protein